MLHYSTLTNPLVGCDIFAMLGEIYSAHNGVLFLDEVIEFNKKTLDILRKPMEDEKISITRVRHKHVFPINFMLLVEMLIKNNRKSLI